MTKIITVMVLLWSISLHCIAQEESRLNSDRVFDLNENFARHRFTVDLGKGNLMQIELADIADLAKFQNLDSIVKVFLRDIEPFKDSLNDELTSKRIDYLADSSSIKKIRIQVYTPKGSAFAVSRGDVSALKLEQDTINIQGRVFFVAKYTLRKAFNDQRYYRVRFFLNNVKDLLSYADGILNAKVKTIQQNVDGKWLFNSKNNTVSPASDQTITAKKQKGYVAGGDYLNFRFSVDLANYKAYFTPAFSLGAGLIISSKGFFKREFILSWDPHFLFNKNAQGQLKTYRNDFLTLLWGQGVIENNEPRKQSRLLSVVSFGYLIHRDGEYFQKRTMRFGAGRLSLFEGKTKIEPMFYFNDLFKGVTPGLRWIQSF